MTVVGTGLTTVAEAAAFLLELCALAAVAYWGYVEAGVRLAVAMPLAFALFWGIFASPRAAVALPEWPKFALRVVVLLGAAAALAAAGSRGLALALGLAVLLDNLALALGGRPVAGGR